LSNSRNSLTYSIQNIVVKLNLKIDLNLKKIQDCLENCEYNHNRFPGLFLRVSSPKSVFIIFKSGKVILTGLKRFNDIEHVLEYLIIQLNNENVLDKQIVKNNIEKDIVNIVITADLYHKIDLDLASVLLENAIYEPEIFPGLIYKNSNPVKSVFLIFSTGKIVFTGIDREDNIEPCLITIGRLIKDRGLFKN
jgi:transcription initiation factor TFIID TATA-box-binding protein